MADELDRRIRRRTLELLIPWPIGLVTLALAGTAWGLVAFIWACTVGLAIESEVVRRRR